MTDIFSTTLMAKVISGLGGLIGGATFMAFMRPKNVWDASIRSSVSTIVAIVGAGPLLYWLKLSNENLELLLLSGAVLGFCAWSFLSFSARTLMKIEDEKLTIFDFWNKK